MTETLDQAIRRLVDLRNQLSSQVEMLQGRIAGLDSAVEVLARTSPVPPEKGGKARRVTELLLELLNESGREGLNARIATEMAAKRGLHLNQQSVSSLLSRLRKSGAIVHNQRRYKLTKFVPHFSQPIGHDEQHAVAA